MLGSMLMPMSMLLDGWMTIPAPSPTQQATSLPPPFFCLLCTPFHPTKRIPLFSPLSFTPSAGTPPASVFSAHAGRYISETGATVTVGSYISDTGDQPTNHGGLHSVKNRPGPSTIRSARAAKAAMGQLWAATCHQSPRLSLLLPWWLPLRASP